MTCDTPRLRFPRCAAALCALFVALIAAPARSASYSFTPLGADIATAVSADGSVVVGAGWFPLGYQAFRWTSGGMVGLGKLRFTDDRSSARGVSADGSVVVGLGVRRYGEIDAFRWTSGGGMVNLGDLPGGSVFESQALGVSADGSVVVGSSISGSREAFRWTEGGGMVGLGDLAGGGFTSRAHAVSADGSVVVGWGDSTSVFNSGFEAFRWTEGGGMVGLGDLAGGVFSSEAYGVSADGSVVVGQSASASGAEAFRWTEGGGMVGLGDLAGGVFSSSALGVSADGSVVVGYGNSASGREAFLWDASDGMQSLRDVLIAGGATGLDDWSLTDATGVSADGRTIVGYGTNPLGEQEAWIATVPEPGTLALALSGLMLLSVFAGQQFRCRRRAAPVP